jgi:hypothetical protein
MSDYDQFSGFGEDQPATLEEEKPPKSPRARRQGGVYDLLAGFFVLAAIGAIVLTVLLVQDPTSSLNPFPPNTPQPTPTLFVLGGGGQSGDLLPPTWTPSPTPLGGASPTPRATATSTGTPPPTATGVTPLPGATNTVAVFPFTLQDEAVTYARNSSAAGCAWLSIVGQVFDLNGTPVPGLPIQVTGDDSFSKLVFSGSADAFGPSGYEVELDTTPKEAEYVVRLLNTTGMPLSEPIVVRTLSSCDRNVAIVNFVQNHEFSR